MFAEMTGANEKYTTKRYFRKNKYQIQSYTTFNMDEFKTIYIYDNLFVVAYFTINGRIYLVSLGNPTFSNMFPRARHDF